MHPVLIDFGYVKIYSYGFCLALAFIVGMIITCKRAKKYGELPSNVIDLVLYALLAGIVGSRFVYVLYYFKYFTQHPIEIIMIQRGGLVFYGGIIAGILTGLFFLIKRKLSILKYSDIFAPAIPLGQAIGRIGCFSNGCCFGKPTLSEWGVVFPPNSPAGHANIFGFPLHPVQVYSSLGLVLIFVILVLYEKHKKYNSQLFLMYGAMYSTLRYFLEFFRGDLPRWVLHSLTTSQVISLFLLILCLIGMMIELRFQRKRNIQVVLPKV